MNRASSSAPKSFDGKDFSFFHLGLIGVLDKWDGLAAMDAILLDIVASDVSYWFYGIDLPTNLNFIAFHGFLDGGADVADADIDTGVLERVRRALRCFIETHTFSPVLVASLTAASRLS